MILEMPTSQKRLLMTTFIILAALAIGGWTRNRLGIQFDVEAVRVFAESLGAAGPILFVFLVAGRSLLAAESMTNLISSSIWDLSNSWTESSCTPWTWATKCRTSFLLTWGSRNC